MNSGSYHGYANRVMTTLIKSVNLLTIMILLLSSTSFDLSADTLVTICLKNEDHRRGVLDKIRGRIVADDGTIVKLALTDGSTVEFPRLQVVKIIPRCLPTKDALVTPFVAELIAKYRDLRLARTRNQVLDQASLGEVLHDLGWELGHSPYTAANITSLMSEPDATESTPPLKSYLGIYRNELSKAGKTFDPSKPRTLLIYWWRGWHDFLFFIVEQGRVVDHGWWYAYE